MYFLSVCKVTHIRVANEVKQYFWMIQLSPAISVLQLSHVHCSTVAAIAIMQQGKIRPSVTLYYFDRSLPNFL